MSISAGVEASSDETIAVDASSSYDKEAVGGNQPLTGVLRYEVLDAHIGQGTYGKVERARDRVDGEIVAIKKVRVERTEEEDSKTPKGYVYAYGINFTVLREIKIMRELNHPNIISVKDVYVEGDFINLVMPHMTSDLRKLCERRVRLSEAQVKCIVKQILEGLHELHDHWFMHRDLCPANVFITSTGVCKVADFGLARMFGSPRPSRKTPGVVTLWYRAPELLYGACYYQDRVDTWSVGCIFAELLLGGRPLLPGTGELDQLGRIFELCGTPSAEVWPAVEDLPMYIEFIHTPPKNYRVIFPAASDGAVTLLKEMLTLDPMKRISAKQALEHPYFTTLPLPCLPQELPLEYLR